MSTSKQCAISDTKRVWAAICACVYACVGFAFSILVFATSSASASLFSAVVTGRVIDDRASKPIEGAIVVAHWTRYVSGFHGGHHQCFHVETSRSKGDGSFEIRAALPALRGVSAGLKPAVVVYSPGYQTSLERLRGRMAPSIREPIVKMSIFWEPLERQSLDENEPIRYLVPSTLDKTDRLRYLNTIARAASCGWAEESEKNGLALLHALRNEASAKAVTNYERYLVRRIEYLIERAEGNKNAVFPERPIPSVVDAVKRRDAFRLEEALRAPGTDPNERDDDDRTALMIASRYAFPQLVKRLLEAGANPNNITWDTGDTALHTAVGAAREAKNSPDRYSNVMVVIQVLLESPTLCTDIPNIFGRTPLDIATRVDQFVENPMPDVIASIKGKQSTSKCVP